MNIEQTNQSVTSLWCPKCCNEFKGELLSSLRSLCIAKMTDFYPLCTVCEDLKSMWKRKKRASKERPSHHFQKLLALEAHCRHFGSGGFFCNWSRWCLTFFSIEKPQHQEQLCSNSTTNNNFLTKEYPRKKLKGFCALTFSSQARIIIHQKLP